MYLNTVCDCVSLYMVDETFSVFSAWLHNLPHTFTFADLVKLNHY